MSVVIAIDGTSGCGKGTLARKLARHYGFAHLDSGALYRLVRMECHQQTGAILARYRGRRARCP